MAKTETLYKVLIADPNPEFCQVLETALTLEGCNVDFVATGEEGIKYVEDRYYDVALIDLNLPDVNGIRLLQRLKDIKEELQVIILSSADSTSFAVEAIKSGAYDFITKPIMIDEIVLAIKKSIKQRKKRSESSSDAEPSTMIGNSSFMEKTREIIQKVAPTDTTVLIVGESGTGKEVVAQEVFQKSDRVKKPFVKISCAALPETLLESELFGYVKGAFTGASQTKKGLFEVADGGTLFLDEITEVSLGIQAKLLRALQEKEIMKLGDTRNIPVDVRFIAATNKDMLQSIAAGKFREDLYYRLNVVKIDMLPLRERPDDLPTLCQYFIQKFQNKNTSGGVTTIDSEVMECFKKYDWPGNIRELENVIERAMVLGMGNIITKSDIPSKIRDAYYEPTRSSGREIDFDNEVDLELEIATLERSLITKALEKSKGVVSRAAKLLKIKRTTLIAKMKKYEIKS